MEIQARLVEAQSEAIKRTKQVAGLKVKIQQLEGEKDFRRDEAESNSFAKKTNGRRIHLADLGKRDNASLAYGELYVCRCQSSCKFLIPNTTKFKPGLMTHSPTQFVRMVMLSEINPELLQDPDSLQIMALNSLPLREKPPSDSAWKGMSHCGTLALLAEDIPGWKLSLMNFQQRLMEKYLGDEVTDPERVTVILCPGVVEKYAPLENVTIQKIADVTQLAEFEIADEPTLLVICVPFSCSDEDTEGWQQLLDMIPPDMDCLIVPAPCKVNDYSLIPVVSQNMKGLKRKTGIWWTLTPDELVPEDSNKSLASIGDTRSAESYWSYLKGLIDRRKVKWRKFGISEKDKSATKTPEKSSSIRGVTGATDYAAKRKRYFQKEPFNPEHHARF